MSLPAAFGVRMSGIASAVPDRVLTNADLERILDTSDEWIRQRTGIVERRVVDGERESQASLALRSLRTSLDRAGLEPSELDLIINCTVTAEMTCPSNACRIAAEIGATPVPAFDLVAACSGYVYGINVGESLVRSGRFRTVGVIGCDLMTQVVDYEDRSVSILFGDAAGSVILRRDPDPRRGCLYQAMGADGRGWHSLYLPRRAREIPPEDAGNPIRIGCLRMQGREVYKFAVNKFREVIEDALEKTGLKVDDVSQFVCHQMNVRIIDAAIERIGLPRDRVRINIDRYGNTSAGSVGVVLDELRGDGALREGDIVIIVAFGGGLTWASSVWRL